FHVTGVQTCALPIFLGSGGHDLLAGRTRSGERELVDVGGAQRVAGRTEAGDDLQHGTTVDDLGERVDEPGADAGRVLAGLEHDRDRKSVVEGKSVDV